MRDPFTTLADATNQISIILDDILYTMRDFDGDEIDIGDTRDRLRRIRLTISELIPE